MSEKVAVTCVHCHEQREVRQSVKGRPCTPRGWTRRESQFYCRKCWTKLHVCRAVVVPVVGPVGRDWSEFREAASTCWKNATSLANWAILELAKHDVVRTVDMKKLPPMPTLDLYGHARDNFPGWGVLDPRPASTLLWQVAASYRSARWEVIWECSKSLPAYRYPTPYPIPNQVWHPVMINEEWPGVSVPFGRDRWTLQLRGGHEFRRQIQAFKKMVSGDAKLGELRIYPGPANVGDHRSGSAGRKNGGGKRYFERLLCRMAVWLPRSEAAAGNGVLRVKTGKEALLVALNEKAECLWTYNADHARRILMARKHQLRRLAQDAKAVREYHRTDAPAFTAHSELLKRKYRRRVTALCHEAAAALANFAARRRFASVLYYDDDHEYCQEFPWFDLKTLIAEKLDACGINFSDMTDDAADEAESATKSRAAA